MAKNDVTTRCCTQCGETKTLDDFGVDVAVLRAAADYIERHQR